MSLINKMLQDLDARGTPAGESFPSQIKPVAREPRGLNKRAVALAAAAVAGSAALLAAGWFAWTQYHAAPRAAAPAPAPAPGPVYAAPAPVVAGKGVGMTGAITVAPVASVAAASVPDSAPAAPVPAADDKPAPTVEDKPAPSTREEKRAERARLAAEREEEKKQERERAAARKKERAAGDATFSAEPEITVKPVYRGKDVAPMEPDSEEAREARRAIALALAARQSTPLPKAGRPSAAPKDTAATAKGKRAVQGRQETTAQRAEGEYRRALASLQEGRMGETVAALEAALKIEPGHEAARQTLVGLLIESKRTDEAMRQLQLGLTLDPRQPALAMLLARLQIERGGSGIDTLTRTLPYAGNNADYHAFLAGALQRQQRHREAAEQYLQALRGAPANGVWWMGLGISLQAEKRNAEALEAFQKARVSGALSSELQGFVERRIQQLGR